MNNDFDAVDLIVYILIVAMLCAVGTLLVMGVHRALDTDRTAMNHAHYERVVAEAN